MENILAGTGLVWLLNILIVGPLARFLVEWRMAAKGVQPQAANNLSVSQVRHWEHVALACYILLDVVILGVAGFMVGLKGHFLAGVPLDAMGWPGVLAFTAACLAGSLIRT